MYRTYNYATLEEWTDKETEVAVANVSYYPFVLVERCEILLRDFIEEYIAPNDKKELLYDIERRSEVVSAKIYSIYEQLVLAFKMLEEIQDYKINENERMIE